MTSGIPWPQNCILANSLPVLESLVRYSDCVTIVSMVQISEGNRDFKVLALDGAGHRSIGYKLRRNMRPSPLLEGFCTVLREMFVK